MNRHPYLHLYLFLLILAAWNAVLYFAGASVLPLDVLYAVKYLLPLGVWLALRRETPVFFSAEPGGVNVILIIFLSIAVQPMLMLLTASVGLFAPYEIPIAYSPFPGTSLPVILFSAAVIPAVCEGIVFRGYLINAPARKKIQTALLNGLFTAVVQLSFSAAPYVFVTGVFFAFITVWTRSLSAGILAHLSVNAFQLAISFFTGMIARQNLGAPVAGLAQLPGFAAMQRRLIINLAIVSVIFLPVAAILMRTFLTHNRQKNIKKDMKDKLQ